MILAKQTPVFQEFTEKDTHPVVSTRTTTVTAGWTTKTAMTPTPISTPMKWSFAMALMTIATAMLISLALGCKPISNQEKNIHTTDTAVGTATNTTSSNTTPGATLPTTTTTTTPSCDQQTWYPDNDNDDYGSTAYTTTACEQPNGYVANADDCNDTDASINPSAEEVCDYIDNDCDNRTDEGQTNNGEPWYDELFRTRLDRKRIRSRCK
jgi:hypothetical protein